MTNQLSGELNDTEISFIEKFQRENDHREEHIDEDDINLQEKHSGGWAGKAFWTIIAILAVVPIAVSTIFMYTINSYGYIVNTKGLDSFYKNLNSKEISQFGEKMGISNFEVVVSVYHHRMTIVAGIFTAFFVIILLLIMFRGIFIYLKNKS